MNKLVHRIAYVKVMGTYFSKCWIEKHYKMDGFHRRSKKFDKIECANTTCMHDVASRGCSSYVFCMAVSGENTGPD